MRIDLKIEILKVLSFNFSFCSEKKEKKDEKALSAVTPTSK